MRGLLLVIAVLFGVLAMHGGLGTYLDSGHAAMTVSTGGTAASSMDLGVDRPGLPMKPHERGSTPIGIDPGSRPISPTELLGASMSSWGHDSHVGEVCLAVLRSAALLAGLLLILLLGRARRDVSRPGLLAVGQPPPGHQPRARGPSLSFLCVLRL
ncbi:hypothetical protein BCD48_33810 [Pseudofrankia sp. BMG5.36]|nr:hypothetical protein BCD48_33810 [Pseudofrankia sp. BMG5.36]